MSIVPDLTRMRSTNLVLACIERIKSSFPAYTISTYQLPLTANQAETAKREKQGLAYKRGIQCYKLRHIFTKILQ